MRLGEKEQNVLLVEVNPCKREEKNLGKTVLKKKKAVKTWHDLSGSGKELQLFGDGDMSVLEDEQKVVFVLVTDNYKRDRITNKKLKNISHLYLLLTLSVVQTVLRYCIREVSGLPLFFSKLENKRSGEVKKVDKPYAPEITANICNFDLISRIQTVYNFYELSSLCWPMSVGNSELWSM